MEDFLGCLVDSTLIELCDIKYKTYGVYFKNKALFFQNKKSPKNGPRSPKPNRAYQNDEISFNIEPRMIRAKAATNKDPKQVSGECVLESKVVSNKLPVKICTEPKIMTSSSFLKNLDQPIVALSNIPEYAMPKAVRRKGTSSTAAHTPQGKSSKKKI
jgi:hypothetical protein